MTMSPRHKAKPASRPDGQRSIGHNWKRTRRWQAIRKAYLAVHRLCVKCQCEGRMRPAQMVAHVRPYGDDWQLFTDESNFSALCKRCYGRMKRELAREDR